MTSLRNRSLALIVAGEALVLCALGVAAWHVYQAHVAVPPRATASGAGPIPATSLPAPRLSPSPPAARPAVSPPAPRATPGLASSDAFLGTQARNLNRDQAAWEAAQWSLVKAAMDVGRSYIEKVVTPAVDRAEKNGG